MDMRPSARQQELIEVARTLAMGKFEPRAVEYDREARFPVVDYVDLRDAGFLGLGADLETYCLVVEEIAKGNAATALTFNMHCLTIRVCGGRALLKQYPSERFLRDAQASSVMRLWTREIATEAAWESALRFARKKNSSEKET
jgi:alkylation response protein AidB-like acyl-CoA dehydrogenase